MSNIPLVAFDHAIFMVNDLDQAAASMRAEFGLGSAFGGTHPSGSMNRIIPVGDSQYIELIMSTNPESVAARYLGPVSKGRDWLSWWSVQPADIHAIASRLGTGIEEGSITFEDGTTGSWSMTGFRFPLPFFVTYHNQETRLERRRRLIAEAAHEVEPWAVIRVEVGDDPADLEPWLGERVFEVVYAGGEPGIHSVTLATGEGELRLGPSLMP